MDAQFSSPARTGTRQRTALRLAAGVLLAVLPAACATPSPEFFGAAERTITQDGVAVRVFWTATRAQAIRLDHASRAQQRHMADVLSGAIETASGCAVIPGSVRGDSGVITAGLRCAAD